jgi:hypothetical protein
MFRWYQIWVYFDMYIPLIVVIMALLNFFVRRIKPIFIDFILLAFLIGQVILNKWANYLQDKDVNNHWLYHVNCAFTQILFTIYFFKIFKSAKCKKLILISFCCFMLFAILNTLFVQPYNTFNSYSWAFGSLTIVNYCLLYFRDLIDKLPTKNLLSLKEFWAGAGILIYFGSCFFIFLSYHYLSIVSQNNVGVLWMVHNIFLTFGCILFLVTFTKKKWIQE